MIAAEDSPEVEGGRPTFQERKKNEVEMIRDFQFAGIKLLKDAPQLRERDKRRKEVFIKNQQMNSTLSMRTADRATKYEEEAVHRSRYFQASHIRDPGSLSVFGGGDGSFFDSWLTNTR